MSIEEEEEEEEYQKVIVTEGGKTCIFTRTLLNFNIESC
jgi:hypothetical protein